MKLRNINGLYGKTKKVYHQYVCLVVYGFESFDVFDVYSNIKHLRYVLFFCSA